MLQTSPGLAGLFGVEARPISMIELYRNRCGQGKCEANCFLMNRGGPVSDSESPAAAEIGKAFVIQNLSRRWRKLSSHGNFFLNYSLDSRLSPKREAALVELVDNHP
ncbi:hypothetical protein [Mesorhizobium sp. KR9-304]|uniref:hypothetical protein n=1 Tax=Mesorhizobium sp. KR9-304 TaxID=3156614 RepID=UPI0032B437DB